MEYITNKDFYNDIISYGGPSSDFPTNQLQTGVALTLNTENITSIPNIPDYNYPSTDIHLLQTQLEKWNLSCVFQTCIEQLIDMKVLACMKVEHVPKLLHKFPLGIIILFEHELVKWQKTIHVDDYLSHKTASHNEYHQGNEKSSPESHNLRKINFKLDEVLNASRHGSLIVEYYKKHEKLNDGIRSTLVDIVIGHIITKQVQMTVSMAELIANQIVAMFTSEIKDTYFLKTGKNPKGKLYSKYYNSIRNLKNNGLVENTSITVHKTQENDESTNLIPQRWTQRDFVPEKDIENILDILKHDITSYPDLERNWKNSINYRLNFIQNSSSTSDIFKLWKQYKIPYGHKLIDIDYNALFPNSTTIYKEFNDKYEKLFSILDEKIKDAGCRKIFEEIKSSSNVNENTKNAAIFHALHAMLAPSSKKVTRDENGKKSYIKYSIKDSQETFMVFGESVEAMQAHIEKLRNLGHPIQPFILVIGSIFYQREILVYFDSILYKLHSILRAVEVCYKLFHLFNLQYPIESDIVWLFIQKYLFCFSSKYDKPYHKLSQILSELNNK